MYTYLKKSTYRYPNTTNFHNVYLCSITFENYVVDQMIETENFHLSSIPEITKILTNIIIQ